MGPDNKKLKVLGTFNSDLEWKNRYSLQTLYVVQDLQTPLLGLPAIQDLGILKFAGTVTQNEHKNSSKTSSEWVKKYPELFTGLGKLQEEYKISLKPDAEPYAIHAPRRIPIPLREKVKEELDRLESGGVIRRVDKPTPWCAPLVPVVKPSGDVRLCVDLTKLNQSVKREKHILPTVEESLGLLSDAKVFTKLDANTGFHQIPLATESQELTTFITPFSRYCYSRVPFGINSAPEHFQKRMSKILEGLPGVICKMDDILVFGRNKSEHDSRLRAVLQRLREAGVTLNLKKCEFGVQRVKFLGNILDEQGIHLDPEKVTAIQNLHAPSDVSGVRRILGMVNHVARFVPNVSQISAPIRALLCSNADFVWGPSQAASLQELKTLICSSDCLAKYNPEYPTIVSADASSHGLGAVLLQKQPDTGEIRAVCYASRSLTPTEGRYAQIEKEALASTWAVERFEEFLRGLDFQIETDHKPLVPLLGTTPLDLLPPRIQRFRIRLMRFTYTIFHTAGKEMATADTLSRDPEQEVTPNSDNLTADEVESYAVGVVTQVPISSERLQELRIAADQDDDIQKIKSYCQDGWPEKRFLSASMLPYWSCRDTITVCDDLLLKDSRFVVPKSLRKSMLQRIHDGHLGITKCRERARASLWWPGLSSEIKEYVTMCKSCATTRSQRAEPMIATKTPLRPWEKVGTDLFEWRHRHYLLVVDYRSRYPEIAHLSTTTSEEVITKLKSIFARHGIADEVISDNATQYTSEKFRTFSREYGFRHITSSPKYPQANGEAERTVKTIKHLLEKSADPYLALLSYRDAPGPTGESPAQISMGRRLQTRLPVPPAKLVPKRLNQRQITQRDTIYRNRQKVSYDRRHSACELPPLVPGDTVWVKDFKSTAKVIQKGNTPRSYVVDTNGSVLRRNRRDLVRYTEPDDTADESSSSTSSPDTSSASLPSSGLDDSRVNVTFTRSGRRVVPPQRLQY